MKAWKSGLLALAAVAVSAGKSVPAAQAADELTYSFTIGATSDYVFRGFSNNGDREPTIQGSVDLAYGIWYAGIWASGANYPGFAPAGFLQPAFTGTIGDIGGLEVDYYVGAKPVTGPVTWDFAFLYYSFPRAGGFSRDTGDYFEFKAAGSISPVENLTLTLANYYTPDFQFNTGDALAMEGTAAYVLPKFWVFTPTVSAAFGTQWGFDDKFIDQQSAFGADQYYWYNAGISLAVEKITMDFRYWGTKLDGITAAGRVDESVCDGVAVFDCSDKFVFTIKTTLP